MCPIVGHLQEVAAGGERNIIPISTDPIELATIRLLESSSAVVENPVATQ